MISGADEQELELANARADIVMALDNTSTYESWLIIDTYVEKLEEENHQLKEKIKVYEDPEDLTLMFMYCDEKAKDKIKELKDRIEKVDSLIDTILAFHLFGDECPLNFGFEKDSLQEKAQKSFYEDDGEYCENNCDECYKKCWLKFFKKIDTLKGEENNNLQN